MKKTTKSVLFDIFYMLCCIFSIGLTVVASLAVVPLCELISLPMLAAPLTFMVFTALMVVVALSMVALREKIVKD